MISWLVFLSFFFFCHVTVSLILLIVPRADMVGACFCHYVHVSCCSGFQVCQHGGLQLPAFITKCYLVDSFLMKLECAL